MRSLVFAAVLLAIVAPQSFPITPDKETFDVIIVGAGLTGLTAARELKKQQPELKVVVLEGRSQLGGRIRYATMATHEGDEWIDLGSQFISPSHINLIQLAAELDLTLVPQLNCGPTSVFTNNKTASRRIKRKTDLNWSEIDVSDLLDSYEAQQLANMTVEDFSKSISEQQASAVNRLLQTFFDARGDTVSALQIALTSSSENATVTELLKDFGHGDSFLVKQGMSELARRLADGIEIRYGQQAVTVNDAVVPAEVETSTGTWTGRQIIFTAPLATHATVTFVPQPEQSFQDLLQYYYPSGNASYFTITYPSAFWRENDKSGKVIYTNTSGPISWLTTFDMSITNQCSNTTSAVLWGLAHLTADVPREKRLGLYHSAICSALGIKCLVPLQIEDVNFSNDRFALGSIPALHPGVPTSALDFFNNYFTLYQNVHLASSDISATSIGTMEGAVVAGQAVAREVLQKLDLTSSIPQNAIVPPADIRLNDSPIPDETTTKFPYSTSSHYPPTLFIGLNAQQPQRDSVVESSTAFVYETSSHYPPTTAIVPTTMQHFSFGNLPEGESSDQSAAVLRDEAQTDNNQNGTFDYQTSTVMPRVIPINISTFVHFSNGNLGSTTAQIIDSTTEKSTVIANDEPNAVFGYGDNEEVSNVEPSTTQKPLRDDIAQTLISNENLATTPNDPTTTFVYSTTTHYPPEQAAAIRDSGSLQQATPSPSLVNSLSQIADQASNKTTLELAQNLMSFVQQLLQGMPRKR